MFKKKNLKTFAQYSVTFLIQHSFCCILPIIGALIGASAVSFHNPWLELLMSVFGAFIGVQLDKFLHRKKLHDCHCHHDEGKEKPSFLQSLIKTYRVPLIFVLIVWVAHQLLFHH